MPNHSYKQCIYAPTCRWHMTRNVYELVRRLPRVLRWNIQAMLVRMETCFRAYEGRRLARLLIRTCETRSVAMQHAPSRGRRTRMKYTPRTHAHAHMPTLAYTKHREGANGEQRHAHTHRHGSHPLHQQEHKHDHRHPDIVTDDQGQSYEILGPITGPTLMAHEHRRP